MVELQLKKDYLFGADSKGIIQAMDFLKNQNQIIDEKIDMHSNLNAKIRMLLLLVVEILDLTV